MAFPWVVVVKYAIINVTVFVTFRWFIGKMLNISNMANVYWRAEILQIYFVAFAWDSVWRCAIASWGLWEYVAKLKCEVIWQRYWNISSF